MRLALCFLLLLASCARIEAPDDDDTAIDDDDATTGDTVGTCASAEDHVGGEICTFDDVPLGLMAGRFELDPGDEDGEDLLFVTASGSTRIDSQFAPGEVLPSGFSFPDLPALGEVEVSITGRCTDEGLYSSTLTVLKDGVLAFSHGDTGGGSDDPASPLLVQRVEEAACDWVATPGGCTPERRDLPLEFVLNGESLATAYAGDVFSAGGYAIAVHLSWEGRGPDDCDGVSDRANWMVGVE